MNAKNEKRIRNFETNSLADTFQTVYKVFNQHDQPINAFLVRFGNDAIPFYLSVCRAGTKCRSHAIAGSTLE